MDFRARLPIDFPPTRLDNPGSVFEPEGPRKN